MSTTLDRACGRDGRMRDGGHSVPRSSRVVLHHRNVHLGTENPPRPCMALGLLACPALAFHLPKDLTKSVPYTRSLRAAAHIVMDSTVRLSDVNLTTCKLIRYFGSAITPDLLQPCSIKKLVLLDARRRSPVARTRPAAMSQNQPEGSTSGASSSGPSETQRPTSAAHSGVPFQCSWAGI